MIPKNKNLKMVIFLAVFTCLVPVVFSTNMDPETIQDLMTPIRSLGDSCGYEGCPTPIEGVLNVHIVPHTHGELGELRNFNQHFTGMGPGRQTSDVNMKRILDYTISELWDDTRRKFTLFDTPYFFHWWANRDDTVHRMVYQLLRQGRLHLVGGGWGMPDEACTSYHAIIDQFTYALRKINKTLGPCARPLVAWQSDVYGHSREFTALASMLGFDGLFINPISFEDEVARMVRKELEMVWRGSDDLGTETDLFTHKLFDGYWSPPGFCYGSMCNDTYIITSDSLFTNVNDKVQEFLNSAQNRQGGNYVTNHIMMVMGKVWAYHDAGVWFQSIDTLIKSVNDKVSDKVHVMYSAPACYLKAVHDSGVPMPIKQDDFMSVSYDKKSHFTGHFTSRPTIKYMAREGHVYLQMAKQMYVLAKLSRKYTKFYEDLNWIMGLFQDHKIITGNMKEDVKDYYTHKMYRAVQKSTILLRTAFNKLRRSSADMIYFRCSFNSSSCRNTNTLRYFVVIYNPLAWPVTVPIRLPVVRHSRFTVYDHKLSRVRSVMMKISEAVLRIPRRNTKADHEIVFIADKMPPMGYRSYFVESVTVAKHKVRRSIIKKMGRNKKKKYLARQTDQLKIDDKSLLETLDHYDYGDDESDGSADYEEDSSDAPSEVGSSSSSTPNYSAAGMADSEEAEADRPMLEMVGSAGLTETPKKWRPGYRDPTTEYTKNTQVPFGFRKVIPAPTADDEAEFIEKRKFFDIAPLKPEENLTTTVTPATRTTTEYYDAMNDPDFDEAKHYFYRYSQDKFIKNKYIKIHLNDKSLVTQITLSNGIKVALTIQLCYYVSDDPVKLGHIEQRPGSNVFRPMDPLPVTIQEHLKAVVQKTYMVEEVQYSLANWAGFVLRVYVDRPVIELDWVVGPVPIGDNLGKDVFIRYSTELANKGVFYTDSNGRQTIKRRRNKRPSYDPVQTNIPSNIYPVTSKIYIEDTRKNIRFSVFNDRSQGGTSLRDGQIDLMVHRRILTNEHREGAEPWLNDTEYGQGIVVRGKHYLYFSKADHKLNKIFEKKFAKEVELAPQIFASPYRIYGTRMKEVWFGQTNEYHGVVKKLPVGLHVLTLQEWDDNSLLLRFENYLELSDVIKGGVRTVFVRDLFANITITSLRETTLGGNVWYDDYMPMQWNLKDRYVKNFNDFYGGNGIVEYSTNDFVDREKPNLVQGIKLIPQQIRTFVATYEFRTT